jgi:hypothetical protein
LPLVIAVVALAMTSNLTAGWAVALLTTGLLLSFLEWALEHS